MLRRAALSLCILHEALLTFLLVHTTQCLSVIANISMAMAAATTVDAQVMRMIAERTRDCEGEWGP